MPARGSGAGKSGPGGRGGDVGRISGGKDIGKGGFNDKSNLDVVKAMSLAKKKEK